MAAQKPNSPPFIMEKSENIRKTLRSIKKDVGVEAPEG
jgi:hypothetical protein